jgi:hypothetical protein
MQCQQNMHGSSAQPHARRSPAAEHHCPLYCVLHRSRIVLDSYYLVEYEVEQSCLDARPGSECVALLSAEVEAAEAAARTAHVASCAQFRDALLNASVTTLSLQVCAGLLAHKRAHSPLHHVHVCTASWCHHHALRWFLWYYR